MKVVSDVSQLRLLPLPAMTHKTIDQHRLKTRNSRPSISDSLVISKRVGIGRVGGGNPKSCRSRESRDITGAIHARPFTYVML